MSRKNSPEAKKRRRVLKALRQTPPAYIDLIEYVRTRTGCNAAMARKVLMSGAIMVDSHPVGYRWENDPLTGNAIKVLNPYLKAEHRERITIQWNQKEAEEALT